MKKLIIILLVVICFVDAKAQFPSTDSLRNYNIVWITNNAARAFTNYRLHTLLAGMIDWIDSAQVGGGGGGGTIGIDSIASLNDSTIRYRKNGTFRTFNLKGVYDSRRKLDTLYKTSDTTLAFRINQLLYTITLPGRTTFVDTIYRKAGQDSIFYRKSGIEYAIKDSTGSVFTADNGLTKNTSTNVRLGGTLSTNTLINQGSNYLRLQNGIPYLQFDGGKITVQPDSTGSSYVYREIKSPFAGTPAQGIMSWYEGMGFSDQSPQRPNYPHVRGFNILPGGGQATVNVPGIGDSYEPHYLPDPGTPTLWLMEAHKFYITPQGKQIRLESYTIETDSNIVNYYMTLNGWALRDSATQAFLAAGKDIANKTAQLFLTSTETGHGLAITADSNNAVLNFQPANGFLTTSFMANQWKDFTIPGHFFDANGFTSPGHQGPFNIFRTSSQSILNFKSISNSRASLYTDDADGFFHQWVQATWGFRWLVDASEVMRMYPSGSLMLGTTGASSANQYQRTFYVDGSIGQSIDSLTTETDTSAVKMLVINNTTGKYGKMSITGTGGGGGGSGDASTSISSSTDGQAALFDGTTGKLLKAFSGSGLMLGTSGVVSAVTTSAGISSALSDETGSGALVFGTSPTFTTSIITPLSIGGTGTGSTNTIQSTSGVGATDAIIFKVGNNGATEGGRFNNGGQLILTNGTASLPSVAFTGNTNTGIYRAASNTLGLSAAGNAFTLTAQTFTFGTWANGQDNAIVGTNAGAGTSNRAANHMQISAGVGTGNGAASEIRFSVGTTGSSGTSLNALSQIMRITTAGINLNQTPNGAVTDSVLSINNTSVRKTVAPNLYTVDGTLTGNRALSGGGNSLELGTSGNALTALTLRSSGLVNLFGTMVLNSTFTATDANYTVLDGSQVINLIEITANRTVALPTATAGKLLIIWNQNSSGFNWSFGGGGASVINPASGAITTLTNDTVYILLGTGTSFLQIN